MSARCRIELLGRFRATVGDRPIDRFQTQKTAALLAYLALHRERSHYREELVDLLWPEADASAARDRLNQALSSLRRQLEPMGALSGSVLTGDRFQVGLNLETVATDLEEFYSAMRSASLQRDTDIRTRLLRQAVAGYGGELLPGFYEDWVHEPRRQAYDAFLRAGAELAKLYEQQGELDAALEFAQQVVAAEPLEEENHFNLIRLLGATGQPAAALRQYRELERILRDQLGEVPAAATKRLIESIRLRQEPEEAKAVSIQRTTAQAKVAVPSSVPRLPARLNRFFAREEELATVRHLILEDKVRLVTLLGAGGCGKTRLSIESASRLSPDFGGAVWFVSLADVSNPEDVPDAVLRTLKPQRLAASTAADQVADDLARFPRALLVLDNFEHLVDGGAPFVQSLLQRVEGLSCLVTSQQRLNLEGEHEVHVSPLRVPKLNSPPDELLASPSVQLFVDRAQAVRPEFRLTPPNAETIRALCEGLEGIPLAIELAASSAQTLTPGEMLAELGHRFTLLVSRRRDIAPRHRTLRATVEYSYLLLPTELRSFFARLSVFHGGWDMEAAREVCEEPHAREYLGKLCERSLVIAEEIGSYEGGTMRFRMLDTLREYAWAQLTGEEASILSGQHADYFIRAAIGANERLKGPEQASWFAWFDHEYRNFQTVLRWCLDSDQVTRGLRLAVALGTVWQIRGPIEEGRDWLIRLLARADESVPPGLRASGLEGLGKVAWYQSDFAAAKSAHERCLEIQKSLGDSSGIASALYHLGIVAIRETDYPRAKDLLEESLVLASEVGDRHMVARALLNLGNIANNSGEPARAKSYYEQSLKIEQALGNHERAAGALNNLGNLARVERKYSLANFYFEECLKIYEELGTKAGTSLAEGNLGKVAARQGDYPRARARLVSAMADHCELGNRFFQRELAVELAYVAHRSGHAERALPWLAIADTLTQEIKAPLPPTDRDVHEETLREVRQTMSAESWEAITASFQAVPVNTAIQRLLRDEREALTK